MVPLVFLEEHCFISLAYSVFSSAQITLASLTFETGVLQFALGLGSSLIFLVEPLAIRFLMILLMSCAYLSYLEAFLFRPLVFAANH